MTRIDIGSSNTCRMNLLQKSFFGDKYRFRSICGHIFAHDREILQEPRVSGNKPSQMYESEAKLSFKKLLIRNFCSSLTVHFPQRSCEVERLIDSARPKIPHIRNFERSWPSDVGLNSGSGFASFGEPVVLGDQLGQHSTTIALIRANWTHRCRESYDPAP